MNTAAKDAVDVAEAPALASLSSATLTARLGELLGEERSLQVEFLQCLAEYEARSIYLEQGYSSLFSYLTEGLHLAGGSAYRRMVGARLLRRFPVLADALRDGRLSLTTLAELKAVLDATNVVELIERVSFQSKEKVQVLVATLRPSSPVRESVRKLARPKAVEVPAVTTESAAPLLHAAEVTIARPRPDEVKPIDADLRVLRVTVSQAFLDELAEAKAALSHSFPTVDFETVVREGFRLIRAAEAKRRGAVSSKPRSKPIIQPATEPATQPHAPSKLSRRKDPHYIPAAVRRTVWQRDRGCCSFVGDGGKVC